MFRCGKSTRCATAALAVTCALIFAGEKDPLTQTQSLAPTTEPVVVATPGEVRLISVPRREIDPSLPRPLARVAINSDCFVLKGGILVRKNDSRTIYLHRPSDSNVKTEFYEAYLDECPDRSVVAVDGSAINSFATPSFTRDFAVRSFAIEIQNSLQKQPAKPRLPLGIIA